MIRILKLDGATEKQLLRARQFRDTDAERVAATIVSDVCKRGDAALFAWTKKLDRLNLSSANVWQSSTGGTTPRHNLPGRYESTSVEFLRAIKHAAKNVRARMIASIDYRPLANDGKLASSRPRRAAPRRSRPVPGGRRRM